MRELLLLFVTHLLFTRVQDLIISFKMFVLLKCMYKCVYVCRTHRALEYLYIYYIDVSGLNVLLPSIYISYIRYVTKLLL